MSLTKLDKPMPTIGVDKYTYAAFFREDSSGLSYSNYKQIPGTVEIAPTDNGGNATFDADNGAYANVSYIESIGHTITNADIPPEVEADWRGLTRESSGMITVDEPKTIYFGVAYRIKKADGTYRYVRFYKGSYSFASHLGAKTQPATGAPDFQTATATYTAVKTSKSEKYYSYIDEADALEASGLTRDEFEDNWFSNFTYEPGTATA